MSYYHIQDIKALKFKVNQILQQQLNWPRLSLWENYINNADKDHKRWIMGSGDLNI